jgi:hypothetical protein
MIVPEPERFVALAVWPDEKKLAEKGRFHGQ